MLLFTCIHLFLPSLAELEDSDVDFDKFEIEEIIQRLDAQGVQDVADVRILKQ